MARTNDPRPVLRSLIDRLVDDDPEREHDPPVAHPQLLREHRDSVMRDVVNLLNTRRRTPPPPKELDDLVPSLADYGLADFLSANLVAPNAREALRSTVEAAIRRYEPRFKRIDVRVLGFDEAAGDRAVRLRIEALLHAEPAPVAVSFDSVVDPVNGGIEVEGRAG